MKKLIKIIIAFNICILVCIVMNISVYAISTKEKSVQPNEFKEWDDGANVSSTTSGDGENYKLSVDADTKGLKEGYYSFYLYENESRNVSSYDGIRFALNNMTDDALKINITMTVDADTSLSTKDTSYAILESEDGTGGEVITPSYGTFEIPVNFSGTIYIPFQQLYNSSNKNSTLQMIQSWGITTVMSQEQEIHYEVSDITFLSDSVDYMKQYYYPITIMGSDLALLPNEGSMIDYYKTEITDMDGNAVDSPVTFYLENEVSGASITSDGCLEITSNCLANELTVCAKTNESINSGKLKIKIQRSGIMDNVGVPKVNDVPSLATSLYNILEKSILGYKIALVLITLVFMIIFYKMILESHKNFQKIKNDLEQAQNKEGGM